MPHLEKLPKKPAVDVISKDPVITLQNVQDYQSEEDFIKCLKEQNAKLSEMIDKGVWTNVPIESR